MTSISVVSCSDVGRICYSACSVLQCYVHTALVSTNLLTVYFTRGTCAI